MTLLQPYFFDEYVDLYERGAIPFNKERIQLVEYLKKEVLVRDDLYFDNEMIQKFILYAEKNFFPLAKYQKFMTPFIFLYKKEDDEVFFNEILNSIARGGGKNGFMSARDSFFISPLYGVRNYDVTITANSEKQGKVSFKEVYETVQARTELRILSLVIGRIILKPWIVPVMDVLNLMKSICLKTRILLISSEVD